MDSDSLKIFCSVASELSITHAAARLGRAPSNISTRIQQLEANIGTELFVRSGKRMTLSTAGERFLDYAKRLLALEDEARHVVTGGREGGALRIGSMESTAASRLPALLAAYHQQHAGTRLALSTGVSRLLLEQVRTGRLDCAFIALPPSFEHQDELKEIGLCARHAWTESLRLLLPASEAQATSGAALHTRSLAAFPQGCTYRTLAERQLDIAGQTDWTIQEMTSYHTMIACVAAGACVALLPESVLALARLPATLVTLPAGDIDTLLVWRCDYAVPAFQNLLDQLDRQVA
jgi:DNA-binding transcriptional LysR family regulator